MLKGRTCRDDRLGIYRTCTLLLCAVLLSVSGMVYAADGDGAPVPTLTVAGFEFSGNHAFSSDELLTVIRDAIGQELTLDDLLAQVHRITAFYRDQGFVLARAFLPNQDVVDGIVRIDVLEGRYGEITLNNASRLRDDVATQHVASLQAGDLIWQPGLERTILVLNDLAGVRAETTFHVGERVGTSDLVISVTDRPQWSASVHFNNHASMIQSHLSATWNNPRGYGDQLTIGVGPLARETQSGRLAYAAPIGTNGLTASLFHSMNERRQSLSGTPIITTSRVSGANLEYPLVRTQSVSTKIGLGFDASTRRTSIGAHLSDESLISRMTLEWRGERTNANEGSLSYSLAATGGRLSLGPDDAAIADAASAQTAGTFFRLNGRASTRHSVWRGFSFNLDLQGQIASKNLHSSEKMNIGGISGVRAYSGNTASGDQGWLVRTHLERGFRLPTWQAAGNWRIFADIGGVQVSRFSWPGSGGGDDVITLAGIGGGLAIARGGWLVEVLAAYPIGPIPFSDRSGRVWLSASWHY